MKTAKQLIKIGHGKNPLNTPNRVKNQPQGIQGLSSREYIEYIINEACRFITVNNHSGHDLQPGDPVYADQIENSNPFSFPIMINGDPIGGMNTRFVMPTETPIMDCFLDENVLCWVVRPACNPPNYDRTNVICPALIRLQQTGLLSTKVGDVVL